ncbi:hypothetical protein F5884DRAFT_775887 [Xylogone sp. PMI_703]|nr:hypothetical protein F5884DRAFT_775887 [Xylogone sp. PMI_703]
MASRDEVTLPPSRPKSRKSLAHVPSSKTMDQENMTADLGALAASKKASAAGKPAKKSRSKSLGPGGLDALSNGTGNRRKSLASTPNPPPRSILKPTMPPLPEIPPRRTSPRKSAPQPSTKASDNLMDFSIGGVAGADSLSSPFNVGNNDERRIALRTEQEQQAAAREREEKERREMEKEITARREARRKSLANRRVSFAPEATLHTWDVVVEYQDSTTSSSANSTRRASSASGTSQSGGLDSDPSEPPSTPPGQSEEEEDLALQQKKRRRSSGIPPMNFNNPDGEFSSSPYSGSSTGDADEIIDNGGDGSSSNDDSDGDDGDNDEEGTMMSIDGGETTEMTMASIKSSSSSGSMARLDAALAEAARHAGTQGIEFDEHGEGIPAAEEEEEEEIIASFTPWTKKDTTQNLEHRNDQENTDTSVSASKDEVTRTQDGEELDEEMTMEMTHAVGGILQNTQSDDDDMSMDVTRALGGIISTKAPGSKPSRRKSLPSNRRQSLRRRSGEETMELTTAIGGIRQLNTEEEPNDEDMSMEFTSVMGGVLTQANNKPRRASMGVKQRAQPKRSRESLASAVGDETMEMTTAFGGIVNSIPEDDVTMELDDTVGMEMTTALGGILPPLRKENLTPAKIVEMEADVGSSPFLNSPLKVPPAQHAMTIASETGSPSLAAFRGKGLRRSTDATNSTTPKSAPPSSILGNSIPANSTPVKKPTTPPKQVTPQPPQPTTPEKSPPSKNIVIRTASPKKLFNEGLENSTPISQLAINKNLTANRLFQRNSGTGTTTPSIILTPQQRFSSGIGIDKVGLGSPRVAELLDRRASIGEQARPFVPSKPEDFIHSVQFADPSAIEEEFDKAHEEDAAREDRRKIFEQEADVGQEDRDATINLKEMISSLTPKKRPLRGRKSLHVGAAKGLLGKRPAELDEEDEEEDNDGIKRLKGHQGSPVKNVKLQGPPSKAETTGRLTRAARKSIEQASTSQTTTPTMYSPDKPRATTPQTQGRFRDAEANENAINAVPFVEKAPIENPEVLEESVEDDRIQLQDFLNMTNIRFMELTTTKRRHTMTQKTKRNSKTRRSDTEIPSLEDCVAAGAATIPMLELFQHACHELKKYIAEGRNTVREIETETFEENPPLFREYMSASADVKVLMDNQLKNVKTHARLLSKGMWYDWRMTLLDTLKEGLIKTAEDMMADEEHLLHQQQWLDSVLPAILREVQTLEAQEADLRVAADELANCDQEELADARQQLVTVDADVAAKKAMVADLRKQLEASELEIAAATEKKQTYLEDIREAEKIREECRGWSSTEINALKAKVDEIEKQSGWTITGISGTTTSMTYRKEVELVFDASSFLPNAANTRSKQPVNSWIDLWYIASNRELNPLPLTAEKEFFLQGIRDHIRGLPQSQTHIKQLLHAVSSSWDKANMAADNIRLLNIICPTEIAKTSDSSIVVRSSLLITPLQTRVALKFDMTSSNGQDGIDVEVQPCATVVYGERFNEPVMKNFLVDRIGNCIERKGMETKVSWVNAVSELGDKLLARGKKAAN